VTPRRSFIRKVIYLVIIAILILPLFWLGQPATRGTGDAKGSPGGYLAQMRAKNNLSQT